ncbi:UbiD family decarboxylase [Geobacter pelophilus]|uniref:UbiD family decarboxylase n=1 Tax=Geoanaerobacter pelophilus TaxID=60036 RepID=A0AAW4L8F2_9BACT|nr:UbiD family decarboxylase [Geoanaerobacter pelophilus]MBT0664855.1 UbiD family decarboxylase [Geoanaerobacter pelophilus]
MVNHDLRDFLCRLEELGEIHQVPVEVDPVFEMSAICSKVCKLGVAGKALLFEKVKGSSFRAAANLFGSEKRLAAALNLEKLADLSGIMTEFLNGLAGASSKEKLSSLAKGGSASRLRPVTQATAPCQELRIDPPDLSGLPIPKSWPEDGIPAHDGRYLTLPVVVTAGPSGDHALNCGMYRAAVLGPDRLAIHWTATSGGSFHAAAWREVGRPMPVAIAVGGPPALTFAAMLPLPPELDEYTFAGLLQGAPITAVRCLTSSLLVPAGAELVIEGVIEPGETVEDGAFGNHTGYYHPSGLSPLVRVTAITHRRGMIYPFTVVGPPPMEDCWLAEAACRLLLPLLQVDIPAVKDVYQPGAGIFHGATIVAVDVTGAGGRTKLLELFREKNWLAGSRLLIFVDADQDPSDVAGVYWRVLNNVEWQRDLVINGPHLAIDATRKPGDQRVAVTIDPETECLIEKRWREYGFNDGR